MKDYVAIITAGGHICSFHAGMLGIIEKAEQYGFGVIGFKDGFKGANSGKYYILDREDISKHIGKGGSIIGASREKSDPKAVKSNLEKLAKQGINVKGVIGMCGDDHLKQLYQLEPEGICVVGWPKTMDNDLCKTYFSLGFPTAAMEAADFIKESFHGAYTNNKIHIATMFGRDTDWVVAAAAAWGGADLVIGGEKRMYDIHEIYEKAIEAALENKKEYGKRFAVVAAGEATNLSGVESHISQKKDIHGNEKLVPEKLALEIQRGILNIDEKEDVSIGTITYELRNCQPNLLDLEFAKEAGERCVQQIYLQSSGNCVVTKYDAENRKIILGLETIPEVAPVGTKRYLSNEPAEFIDYEKMKVTREFIEYYKPIFGEPLSKEHILFGKLEERSID